MSEGHLSPLESWTLVLVLGFTVGYLTVKLIGWADRRRESRLRASDHTVNLALRRADRGQADARSERMMPRHPSD